MDGRVQTPVTSYLKKRFNVQYVDMITEPGVNRILSGQDKPELVESILGRLKISVQHHNSHGIAIIGHHDCAGNNASKEKQILQLEEAGQFVSGKYSDIEVITFWVDEFWKVHELSAGKD
jgi:carbonic anhydrase